MKKTLFLSSLLAVLFPSLLAGEAQTPETQTPEITFTYTNYDAATGRYDSEVAYANLISYQFNTAGAVGMITTTEKEKPQPSLTVSAPENSGITVEKRPLFVNKSVVNVVNSKNNYVVTADANGNGGVYGSRTLNVTGDDTFIPYVAGGITLHGNSLDDLYQASSGKPILGQGDVTINLYAGTIRGVYGGFQCDNIALLQELGSLSAIAVQGNVYINVMGSSITEGLHGCGTRAGSVEGEVHVNVSAGSLNGKEFFAGARKGCTFTGADGKQYTEMGYSGSTYFAISGGTHGTEAPIKVHAGGSGDETLKGTVKGDTHMTLSGGYLTGSIYGGGQMDIITGNTYVLVSGGSISNNVYGGGESDTIGGSTYVTISDGLISGNVYGGGESDTVNGGTHVTISGGSIGGNVYATGDGGSTVKENAVVTWTGSSASVTGSVIGKDGKVTVGGKTILNLGTAESAFTGTLSSGKLQGFDSINAVNVCLSGANYLDGAALSGAVQVALDTKLTEDSSYMTLTEATGATLTYTVDLSNLSSLLGVGGALLTIGEEAQSVSLEQLQWLNGGDSISVDWNEKCLKLTEGDSTTTLSFTTTDSDKGISSIVFDGQLVTTTASGEKQSTTEAAVDTSGGTVTIMGDTNSVTLDTDTSLGNSGTASATITTDSSSGAATSAELTLTGKEETTITISKDTSESALLNTKLNDSTVTTLEITADNTTLSGNTITTATLSGASSSSSAGTDSKLVLSNNSIGEATEPTSSIANYKEVALTGTNTLTNTTLTTKELTVANGKQTITGGSNITADSGTVSGEIELKDSTLTTAGNLQQKITFNESATLSGTGTVSGISMAGGTLRVGNSPGVMNIGNADFQGGEWKFCLVTNADWDTAILPTTHHSRLAVTNDTTADHVRVSFYYEQWNGTDYVLSDAARLADTFREGDSLTLITGTDHLKGSYTVDYASLPSLASGYIWETGKLFSAGTITVIEEWQEDLAMVADSAVSAADIASGFSQTALAQASMPRSGANRSWVSALGNFRNISSHSGVSGYEGKNFGAAVGFDRSIGKHSLLGLALGYSTGDYSMDAGNGFYSAAKVDQDATLIGLYGLSECPKNGLRLSGFVTYGAYEQEADRYSTTTGCRAHTEWDATAWNLGATLSKDFALSCGSKLTPFVGVEYSYVSLDDATESGAYAARYREESAYQNLALKLGATLSRDIKLAQGTLTPYASVSYAGDALRRNAKLSTSGLHGEDAGHSVKTSRNAVEFRVGGNWAITESWSAGASYSAELRDEATRQNVNLSVGYSF
ncbi:MAG: autotransporter domain-containing protein [Akkermansia sp.]